MSQTLEEQVCVCACVRAHAWGQPWRRIPVHPSVGLSEHCCAMCNLAASPDSLSKETGCGMPNPPMPTTSSSCSCPNGWVIAEVLSSLLAVTPNRTTNGKRVPDMYMMGESKPGPPPSLWDSKAPSFCHHGFHDFSMAEPSNMAAVSHVWLLGT